MVRNQAFRYKDPSQQAEIDEELMAWIGHVLVKGGDDLFIGWEWKSMDDGMGFTVNTIFKSHQEFDRFDKMIRDNSTTEA